MKMKSKTTYKKPRYWPVFLAFGIIILLQVPVAVSVALGYIAIGRTESMTQLLVTMGAVGFAAWVWAKFRGLNQVITILNDENRELHGQNMAFLKLKALGGDEWQNRRQT